MPWSRRKSRKFATQFGIFLGFVASIPINLASNWIYTYIFPSILYSAFAIILVLIALYYVIKKHDPLLTSTAITFAASVLFNVFSSWVQESILHNSFTLLSITIICLIAVITLILSSFIGSHPVGRFENKRRRIYRRRAKVALASEAEKRYVRKQPKKTIKQKKR